MPALSVFNYPVTFLKTPSVMEEKAPAKRPSSKMFVRVSKFKHLKGDVMLKGKFENLKNLSKSVPAESNLIEGKKSVF